MNSQNQRLAVIDMGTNTFNLLVAEVDNNEVHFTHREKISVAFGAGSMQSNVISKDATDRAIDALRIFQNKAHDFACSAVQVYSTAVLRNAQNRVEVVTQIEQATHLRVEVITGEKEAHWIASSALYGIENSENALVLDIGGGSVEMIYCKKEKIISLASFPLGLTLLFESSTWSDPLSDNDLSRLYEHFELHCATFLSELKVSTLIGTAGVFETLVELTNHESASWSKAVRIDTERLKKLLQFWLRSTAIERESWTEIIEVRRRTLNLAAAFLLWLIESINCKNVIATPNSMAEGVALDVFSVKSKR